MGIGDRRDPTTDFFDTHRAQCEEIVKHAEDAALVGEAQKAIAACDAAIARGRRRVDMPAVVAEMPTIRARYAAMPEEKRREYHERVRADRPREPRELDNPRTPRERAR